MMRLLLTSGRGPAECRIALAKALDIVVREAEQAGIAIDIASGPAPDTHGPASVIAMLSGEGSELLAQRWVGSVLWVCRSTVRPHHRRKNWFIGVSKLADTALSEAPVLKPDDIRFETFRAGGAGGQHQNKTESAVRAVHVPTGLAVVAREERSQHRNKATAVRRLGELIGLQAVLRRDLEKLVMQAQHDQLERGRPVRTFVGHDFKEA